MDPILGSGEPNLVKSYQLAKSLRIDRKILFGYRLTPRITPNKDKRMDEELSRLHALYTEFIRRRKAQKPQSALNCQNRYFQQIWGSPLSLEEFRVKWERICLDPALKQYWLKRLGAVSSLDSEPGNQGVAA